MPIYVTYYMIQVFYPFKPKRINVKTRSLHKEGVPAPFLQTTFLCFCLMETLSAGKFYFHDVSLFKV